jgi:hypothetical protein
MRRKGGAKKNAFLRAPLGAQPFYFLVPWCVGALVPWCLGVLVVIFLLPASPALVIFLP